MAFSFVMAFFVYYGPFRLSYSFMFFWLFLSLLVVYFYILFNFVSYVFLLCLCILIVMSVLFCIFRSHRANWHSSVTLPEVFPCIFLNCKANARVWLAKTRHGPHSSRLVIVSFYVLFVLFCVLFVLCRSVYCLCVNVYCTTATGWQPNCS